jgi:phosphoglycerol transferase MdoB-like AlkP superfamily enzyme
VFCGVESFMNRIVSSIKPHLPVALIIGVVWAFVQGPLLLELARPWIQNDIPALTMLIRLGSIIMAEWVVLAGIYCFSGRRIRRAVSVFFSLACIFTIANRAYWDYFGNILHPLKLRELYTLFYIREQLLEQILHPLLYAQLAASFIAGFFLLRMASSHRFASSLRLPTRVAGIVIAIGFAFIVQQAQVIRFNNSVSHARSTLGNATAYFMFGAPPVYAGMLLELWPAGRSSTAVPAIQDSLNRHLPRRPVPRLDPDAIFFIQAESLDGSAIFHVSSTGNPLMPFLRALVDESVLLDQFFHHHNGAASASAEIGALLGSIPSYDHNGFTTMRSGNMHPLNEALKPIGFTSLLLHSNRGSFLGRSQAYAKMGFDHFLEMKHFSSDAAGFQARDDAFFTQSMALIDHHVPEGGKPFAYLITMQTHGPFRNFRPATAPQLAGEGFFDDAALPRIFHDYLCSMRELDEALALLWNELRHHKRFKTPLVLLFPDHVSGVFDKAHEGLETGKALIWSPDITPGIIQAPTTTYDLPPTIMHLLAGDGARWSQSGWWIGDTIFTTGARKISLANNVIIEGESPPFTRRTARPEEQKFLTFSHELQR